jgi:putative DNA primase/helicase
VELVTRLQNLADGVTRGPHQRLECVTAQDLLDLKIAPREMLLAPVLPTQGLAMLYSKRGLGKTYMSLSIAYAVASGDEFLGWRAPRPRPVLFVDGELPAATLRDRLAAVTKSMMKTAAPGMLRLITPDLQAGAIPDLATREGQALVENALGDAEFVILDNLSALCVSGKENEGESWLPVQRWALRLRQRGVSVLFVHHAGKGGAQRGTSRREDLLDVVINLRHPADYNPAEGLRCEVHYEKCRGFYGEDAKPFEVKMHTGVFGEAIWTKRDLEDSLEMEAAAMFDDGAKVREVARQLGIPTAKAGRIRKRRKRGEDPDHCCNTTRDGLTPECDSEDRDV